MENNLNTSTKSKKPSKQNDNKSCQKARNTNKNNPQHTFTQKKIYQKSLYDISLKNDYKIKPIFDSENQNQYSLNLDNKLLSNIFNYDFENSIEPPNLKNETVLNFQKFSHFSLDIIETQKIKKKNENFSSLFQYGAQYVINDIHSSLYNNIKCIIKIQSFIRGYLVKKNLIINNLDKIYFEKNSIKAIIKIQKNIKGFLERINIRKRIIIKHIYQKRESAVNLIIKRIRDYINVIKIKKKIFIDYFLEQRKQKAKYIQNSYRNYRFYKSYIKLKKDIDKSYFLYYPYNEKKVEIIIYFDDDNNNKYIKYSFIYNTLLKYYILLIDPCKIFSGKYKCQFVVNDIIIFDNRYPMVQQNNNFFNIIELIPRNNFKCLIKQKKIINKIIKNNQKKKICGNLFGNKKFTSNIDNNLNNSTNIYLEKLRLTLEDIKEEDDEGKSVTSKDTRYEKRIKDYSDKSIKICKNEEVEKKQTLEEKIYNYEDEDSFDFTEEEYNEIKKINNKNFENSNYLNLKNGLKEKKSVNKLEKIRKSSIKNIKENN